MRWSHRLTTYKFIQCFFDQSLFFQNFVILIFFILAYKFWNWSLIRCIYLFVWQNCISNVFCNRSDVCHCNCFWTDRRSSMQFYIIRLWWKAYKARWSNTTLGALLCIIYHYGLKFDYGTWRDESRSIVTHAARNNINFLLCTVHI